MAIMIRSLLYHFEVVLDVFDVLLLFLLLLPFFRLPFLMMSLRLSLILYMILLLILDVVIDNVI